MWREYGRIECTGYYFSTEIQAIAELFVTDPSEHVGVLLQNACAAHFWENRLKREQVVSNCGFYLAYFRNISS